MQRANIKLCVGCGQLSIHFVHEISVCSYSFLDPMHNVSRRIYFRLPCCDFREGNFLMQLQEKWTKYIKK